MPFWLKLLVENKEEKKS